MRDTKFRTRLFLCFLAVIVMTLVLPGLYVRKNIKEDGIDETVRNARREAVLIRMQMETAPDGVHGLSSTFDRIGTELGIRITFIGADGQLASIDNLSRVINAGFRYSIPTLGVVAVGKDMERTDRFFKLATRIVAEMGVQLVKTYYCDNFEEIVAACPVPIVVAGGKKLPEDEALTLAYRSIQGGARGLDMGRNIFQSEHSAEMAQAIRKIVHEGYTDKEAYEFYQDLIH